MENNQLVMSTAEEDDLNAISQQTNKDNKINDTKNNFDIEKKMNKTNFPPLRKNYGKMMAFYFDSSGDPLFVIGPHCKYII